MTLFSIFARHKSQRMKKLILAFTIGLFSTSSFAQDAKADSLKKGIVGTQKKFNCDSIVVDFESGLINGKIGPLSPIDSIKKYLPCVAEEIPAGSDDRICGGGASLGKKGIFFNLEHGLIEFTLNTKAHLPYEVMGATEEELIVFAGDAKQVFDLQPYTDRAVQSVYLYQKSYGCLAIWVDQKDKKVFKVQLQSQPQEKAYLCVD